MTAELERTFLPAHHPTHYALADPHQPSVSSHVAMRTLVAALVLATASLAGAQTHLAPTVRG
jgi:hypothetical protein